MTQHNDDLILSKSLESVRNILSTGTPEAIESFLKFTELCNQIGKNFANYSVFESLDDNYIMEDNNDE
jgi:hypothetical protein